MARIDNLTNFLTDIADAIRDKKGTTGLIQASNFDTEIENISSGSDNIGIEFNQIDDDGFPIVVTTRGLVTLPANFFRNVNENNGQYIKTTEINLNKEIVTIGSACFRESGVLNKLIINSETVPTLVSTNAFQLTPIEDGTGFIYVKDNLVSEYKNATNWNMYASQIKGISELGG